MRLIISLQIIWRVCLLKEKALCRTIIVRLIRDLRRVSQWQKSVVAKGSEKRQSPKLCSLREAARLLLRRAALGMPFIGNAVLQGCDWVAFQCLWPCEYACAGKPCQFCFSGGQFEALARRHKPMPFIPSPRDVSEVVLYAVEHDGVNSMQLTGGSTFKAEKEEEYITAYLEEMNRSGARAALKNELLLYITPPEPHDVIDR